MVSQMQDLGSFAGFRRASAEAFATAGVCPGDIGHLMVYDAFAHLPLYGLEDLGFVGHGESADFIADGNTRPGGKLPMNTNGGGLSYTPYGQIRDVRRPRIGPAAARRGGRPGAWCGGQLRSGRRHVLRRRVQPGPVQPEVNRPFRKPGSLSPG